MNCFAIINTIGYIIISGLGLFFTYKARTKHYKQELYSKQLEAFLELNGFINKMMIFLACKIHGIEEEQKELSNLESEFFSLYLEKNVLLPRSLRDAFFDFYSFIKNEEMIKELKKREDGEPLIVARDRIYFTAQQYFGIESLSKQRQKLLRKEFIKYIQGK